MQRKYWLATTEQEQSQEYQRKLPIAWRTSPPGLAEQAESFDPISLKQMEAAALLDRTDTKYVMAYDQLLNALASVEKDYSMLSVKGLRLNHYRTLYFDTADFALYNLHINGRADRYKVRSREYTDSNLSFFEIKHKTAKDRTIKMRISTDQQIVRITKASEGWLSGIYPYDSRALEPKIWNIFSRMTLVGKRTCERVTIDVNLAFTNEIKFAYLDGLAIAEVKNGVRKPNISFCGTDARAKDSASRV